MVAIIAVSTPVSGRGGLGRGCFTFDQFTVSCFLPLLHIPKPLVSRVAPKPDDARARRAGFDIRSMPRPLLSPDRSLSAWVRRWNPSRSVVDIVVDIAPSRPSLPSHSCACWKPDRLLMQPSRSSPVAAFPFQTGYPLCWSLPGPHRQPFRVSEWPLAFPQSSLS